MYVSPHFAERELSVLHDTIEAVRFGQLVLSAGDVPLAAHIPFVLHRDAGDHGTLLAHVARRDPLARHLDGREALAIFGGPSAYVSPRFCPTGGLPTYNYLAVHAHGRPRPLRDSDAVLAHLAELAAVHERSLPDPWLLADAPADYLARLLPHITAFSFPIDALQGKRKLSQNRAAEDRDGIIRGLRARGSDADLAIADTMAAYPYPSDEAQSLVGS
jgi:transcriptional regulator